VTLKCNAKSARTTAEFCYPVIMSLVVPLNEMTIPEKLRLMEALWESLSRESVCVESPEWHREVLEERERRVASGEAQFTNCETAKADIRERCRAD
jgi:hypothetical protein